MKASKHFLNFFTFTVILPAISSKSVTLNSTLIRGQYACPGHQVTFTCVLSSGAYINVVTWTSEQYIGKCKQLEFNTYDEEGFTADCKDTVATLVRISGGHILESSLQLNASASIPNATVKCRGNNSVAVSSDINFSLLEIPDTPRNVTAMKQTSELDPDCAIHLQWQPPSNTEQTEIKYYIITIEDTQSVYLTKSSSSETANLIVKSCASDAVIKVSAVDSCGREGPTSNGTLTELLVPNPPTTVTTAAASLQCQTASQISSGVNKTNSSHITIIVGTVLGTALLLIALVLAIAFPIGVIMNAKRHRGGGRSQSRDERGIVNQMAEQNSSSDLLQDISLPEQTASPSIHHEMLPVDDGHEDPTTSTGSEKSRTTDQTNLLSVPSNPEAAEDSQPSSGSPNSPRSMLSKPEFLRSMSNKVEEFTKSNSLTRGSSNSYKLVENENCDSD